MADNDDIKAWINATNAQVNSHRAVMCMMGLILITLLINTGVLVWFEVGGRAQVIREIRSVPDMIQQVRIESKYGRFDVLKEKKDAN